MELRSYVWFMRLVCVWGGGGVVNWSSKYSMYLIQISSNIMVWLHHGEAVITGDRDNNVFQSHTNIVQQQPGNYNTVFFNMSSMNTFLLNQEAFSTEALFEAHFFF